VADKAVAISNGRYWRDQNFCSGESQIAWKAFIREEMAHQSLFCARATLFCLFGKTNPVGGPARWGCDWKGIGFRLPVDGEGSEGPRVEVGGCERE
jgi:hypothetical protein